MFLGIDLGTSEVKVLLVDEAGRVAGVAGAPLEVSRPHPRWSEQPPEEWWRATVAAVEQLRGGHRAQLAAVRGIGLSGQMHGATLLDATDQPLRPAILWNDTRSDRECSELLEREPTAVAITGNRIMPGFTAPKLLWVARHEPEVFARVASVLLPKDYVRLRLTGEKVSEPSDASGTLWLDVARRDWSDEMLAATRLTRAHMPRLVEGSAPSGRLLPAVAATLGIEGTPIVAGGGGDNAASAIGIGAVSPGDGFLSLGTSGVLFLVNDRFMPAPARAVHAFCHAVPARWHQMSVMLSAASCLRWLSRLLGVKEADLVAEVEGLDPTARARAPIFLPYLSGERTPHDDAAATGVLHGLTHETSRPALTYAVLEGVAFGLADGLEALKEAGAEVEALSVVGGGARSGVWTQLIADVLGLRLETPEGGERGAALGAARLARIACGEPEDAVCVRPPVARTHLPSTARTLELIERRARFRELYPAVAPLWPSVG